MIIVIMIFSIQIVSVAAFKFSFFDWSKDMFLSLTGIETNQDDISHSASNSKNYKTLEEFELAENIDITMPTWLPNDIKIESISYSYDYEKKQVYIFYYDTMTSLLIKLNSNIPNTNNAKIYEHNNIIFYLFEEANVLLWEYNGNFYNLTCGFNIIEYAEKIIENIK